MCTGAQGTLEELFHLYHLWGSAPSNPAVIMEILVEGEKFSKTRWYNFVHSFVHKTPC